ncbi:unnamed protein product [Lactuca virosa]|uniref:Uncharacterized protein n=1 Tax=Lactuca virosa TaxID=75947 RepID=A0AAU9LZR8_9ASTR|nr:unnamed protein product [Lactuca virosa]
MQTITIPNNITLTMNISVSFLSITSSFINFFCRPFLLLQFHILLGQDHIILEQIHILPMQLINLNRHLSLAISRLHFLIADCNDSTELYVVAASVSDRVTRMLWSVNGWGWFDAISNLSSGGTLVTAGCN